MGKHSFGGGAYSKAEREIPWRSLQAVVNMPWDELSRIYMALRYRWFDLFHAIAMGINGTDCQAYHEACHGIVITMSRGSDHVSW